MKLQTIALLILGLLVALPHAGARRGIVRLDDLASDGQDGAHDGVDGMVIEGEGDAQRGRRLANNNRRRRRKNRRRKQERTNRESDGDDGGCKSRIRLLHFGETTKYCMEHKGDGVIETARCKSGSSKDQCGSKSGSRVKLAGGCLSSGSGISVTLKSCSSSGTTFNLSNKEIRKGDRVATNRHWPGNGETIKMQSNKLAKKHGTNQWVIG
mmetsp:Transcript_41733/g.126626  ORF Transcript_41733/g.126626 Transcript_41733/m.126626 type:complete len:211 (-) Transcript_41733:276-908(-)